MLIDDLEQTVWIITGILGGICAILLCGLISALVWISRIAEVVNGNVPNLTIDKPISGYGNHGIDRDRDVHSIPRVESSSRSYLPQPPPIQPAPFSRNGIDNQNYGNFPRPGSNNPVMRNPMHQDPNPRNPIQQDPNSRNPIYQDQHLRNQTSKSYMNRDNNYF